MRIRVSSAICAEYFAQLPVGQFCTFYRFNHSSASRWMPVQVATYSLEIPRFAALAPCLRTLRPLLLESHQDFIPHIECSLMPEAKLFRRAIQSLAFQCVTDEVGPYGTAEMEMLHQRVGEIQESLPISTAEKTLFFFGMAILDDMCITAARHAGLSGNCCLEETIPSTKSMIRSMSES